MTGVHGTIGFWIWPSLIVTGLVLLGYLAYRLIGSRGTGNAARGERELLARRLALGEIDEDEYRRRRAQLR